MEEIVMRFPIIAQQILEQLDNQNLTKCREVDKTLSSSIDKDRLIWTRMIKNYINDNKIFTKSWNLVMKKVPVKYLKDLALTTQKLGTVYDWYEYEYQPAPQHIVAACGSLSLYKFTTEKTGEINPRTMEGMTPLHYASDQGQFEICEFIVDNVDDKNPADAGDGWTPLHFAASHGNLAIYQLISQHVSDKNPKRIVYGKTPIHEAAIEGHFEMFKLIISNVTEINPSDDSGWTPLHASAMHGYLDIYEFLLERVKDQNPGDNTENTPLHGAVISDQIEIFKIAYKLGLNQNPGNTANGYGDSLLDLAAQKNRAEIFRLIIENENLEKSLEGFVGELLLHQALYFSAVDVCKIILQYVKNKNPIRMVSALHVAAMNGLLDIYKYISERVVNQNPITEKSRKTPLHSAVDSGHLELCKYIIEVNGGANLADSIGNTPLHYAIQLSNRKEIAKVIVEKATNKNPKNHLGVTPLDLAARYDNFDVAQIIIRNEGLSWSAVVFGK